MRVQIGASRPAGSGFAPHWRHPPLKVCAARGVMARERGRAESRDLAPHPCADKDRSPPGRTPASDSDAPGRLRASGPAVERRDEDVGPGARGSEERGHVISILGGPQGASIRRAAAQALDGGGLTGFERSALPRGIGPPTEGGWKAQEKRAGVARPLWNGTGGDRPFRHARPSPREEGRKGGLLALKLPRREEKRGSAACPAAGTICPCFAVSSAAGGHRPDHRGSCVRTAC